MNRVDHPGYLGLERGKGIVLHPGVSEAPRGLYLIAAKGRPHAGNGFCFDLTECCFYLVPFPSFRVIMNSNYISILNQL